MKTWIYLVHGTWARDNPVNTFRRRWGFWRKAPVVRWFIREKPPEAPWFEEKSRFRLGLSTGLDCEHEYVVANWSGRNTLRARLAAAEALRDLIREGFRNDPGGRHVVVAHSHGGNVALDAIDGLEPGCVPHGLCSLATPFLEIGHRETPSIYDSAILGTLLGTLIILAGVVVAAALYSWLLAIALVLVTAWLARKWFRPVLSAVSEAEPLFRSLVTEKPAPDFSRRPPLFVVRANLDEASAVLTLTFVAGTVNRLARGFWAYVLNCLFKLFMFTRDFLRAVWGIFEVVATIFALVLFGYVWDWWNSGKTNEAYFRDQWAHRDEILVQFRTVFVPPEVVDLPPVRFARLYLPPRAVVLRFLREDLKWWLIGVLVLMAALLAGLSVLIAASSGLAKLLMAPFGGEMVFFPGSAVPKVNASPTGVISRFFVVPDSEIEAWKRHAVYNSPIAQQEIARWVRALDVPGTRTGP